MNICYTYLSTFILSEYDIITKRFVISSGIWIPQHRDMTIKKLKKNEEKIFRRLPPLADVIQLTR